MLTIEEVAQETGTSVLSACRAMIRLLERGVVQSDGPTDDAIADLKDRIETELQR